MVKGNKDAKGQGFDGNPQNINRKGRPKSLLNEIKEKLTGNDTMVLKDVDLLDADGKPTGQKVDVMASLDSMEALAIHYVKRAKKSDRVLIHLLESIDGKPKMAIDTKLNIENISEEQASKIASQILKNLNDDQ